MHLTGVQFWGRHSVGSALRSGFPCDSVIPGNRQTLGIKHIGVGQHRPPVWGGPIGNRLALIEVPAMRSGNPPRCPSASLNLACSKRVPGSVLFEGPHFFAWL